MKFTKLRCAAAASAIVAIGVGGVASMSASAADAGKAGGNDVTKIKMEVTGKGKNLDLFFQGPKQVEKGTKLEIVNKTNPGKVGPHTFTLVKKSSLPETSKQIKKCEQLKLALCMNVAKAHEFDPQTETINKPKVEVGKKGWDKSFGKTGDSWVAEAAGEHNTRKVSASDGTTLHYICVVHPFMQGKIKVVK